MAYFSLTIFRAINIIFNKNSYLREFDGELLEKIYRIADLFVRDLLQGFGQIVIFASSLHICSYSLLS